MPAETSGNKFKMQAFISGPGFDTPSPTPTRREPARAIETPVKLRFGPDHDAPLEDQDADAIDGARLARRIFVAFLLVVGVWILFVTLLAQHISPMVPLLASVVIMAGAILAAKPESSMDETADELDDARPIGCCSGPRPLGEMSRKAANARGGPGCGC